MLNVSLKVIVFTALISYGYGSYFTSVKKLTELLDVDFRVYLTVKKLGQDETDEIFVRKLASWTADIEQIKRDSKSFVTNPLNGFKLIKRSSVDLNFFDHYLPGLKRQFEDELEFPTKDDLIGAIHGVIRLQKVYQLKTADLVNGIINGVDTGATLSLHDVFTLGFEISKIGGENYLALEYLKLAEAMNYEGSGIEPIKISEVLFNVYVSNFDLANAQKILSELDKGGQDRLIKRNHGNYNRLRSLSPEYLNVDILNSFNETFIRTGIYEERKETIIFQQICRGDIKKSPKEQSKLTCRYQSTNAFTIIAPFKVEIANIDPELLVFYDVLSAEETEKIELMLFDTITKTADIYSDTGVKQTDNRIRVAELHWFQEESDKIFEKLTVRLEDMTGLSMETAEGFQVQNYGVGGHYNPHWDQSIKRSPCTDICDDGNRIATVLFYLTDVEMGGATAFPYTKTLIPSVRGSAAFWHNLRSSGTDDYFTRHAACPVLMGSKTVMNKWIHSYGQEFRRPCQSDDSEEQFENDIYLELL